MECSACEGGEAGGGERRVVRVCLPLLLLERRGGVPPLPSPEGFPIASLRRVRSIWWHPLGRGESERVSG